MKFFLLILFALVACVIGANIKNPVNGKYNEINKEMLSKRMEADKKVKNEDKEEAVDDRFLNPNCGYNLDINFIICDDYNDKYKFYCQCSRTAVWSGRAYNTPNLCDVLETYCCNGCSYVGRKLDADSISESEQE